MFITIFIRLGILTSNRLLTCFTRADANHALDGTDKNFPVSDFPRLGSFQDRIDNGRNLIIREHEFHLDLRQKIHGIFTATIDFRVPFLTAKAFDLGNGQSLNP